VRVPIGRPYVDENQLNNQSRQVVVCGDGLANTGGLVPYCLRLLATRRRVCIDVYVQGFYFPIFYNEHDR
jgi:hypothetical protein